MIMTTRKTLKLLDKLIKETRGMTHKQWREREKKLGVDKMIFDPKDYIDKERL